MAGVWFAGREATLLWAVERAEMNTNGRLTTAGVSGSLLGTIRFARIAWHDDGVEAVAENGALEFSPLPLLWRKIDVDRLQAEVVRIALPDGGEAPAQIPESLRIPWRVSLEEVTVANLEINHPDFGERFTKVSFELDAGTHEWRASIKAAETRFGYLTGFGQIETESPFAVSGSAEVRDGNVVMNARRPVIRSAADMRFTGLQLNRLFPALKTLSGSVGTLDGRARLTGGGNSIAAMLGEAGGQVAFLMNGGEMSDLTLRLANLDIANALPALLTGDHKVPIRCFVADFSAQQGRFNVSTLVLDAAHTTLEGAGSIDLGDERLDLRIVAHPKEWSLFALRGPILVTGTLADPSVTPDLAGIALRTGVAVGLGVVATPLAALIPFIAPGQRPQTDCSSLIADVRGFTAPPDAASSIKGARAGS